MSPHQYNNISKIDPAGRPGGKCIFFKRIAVAETFFKKMAGLIFSSMPGPDEGLLLDKCNSIHTFWMRFSLDVLFLDKNGRIVHLIENLRPFHFSPAVRNAAKVLEIAAGEIKRKNISAGDIICLK